MGCKINQVENGPLIVECKEAVIEKEGVKIEVENPAYLCRCGNSKNKPFCDGTHQETGFLSKRDISKEIIQIYEGKDIRVNFNRSICAGAAACVRTLPSVFKTDNSTDWIHPDNDKNEMIIKTIKACPSGALSYALNGETHIDKRDGVKVSVIKNGPYRVEGNISLENDLKPMSFSETKYMLCRCGHSKNKPYCDYSHAQNGWKDE